VSSDASPGPSAGPGVYPKLRACGSEVHGPPKPRTPIALDLRQEPGAGKPHAGICAGGPGQPGSLPRPRPDVVSHGRGDDRQAPDAVAAMEGLRRGVHLSVWRRVRPADSVVPVLLLKDQMKRTRKIDTGGLSTEKALDLPRVVDRGPCLESDARQRLPSRTTLGPPGLAVSGDTTLLRRFGETFHCRPSSVMTVTVFLL